MTAPTSAGDRTPAVSVLVVDWNGGDLLLRCLQSVTEDAGRPGVPTTEVVVVDNASTDGAADRAQERFPGLIVLRQESNLGFAGGANAGIRAARGAVIVLVNNDAEVRGGFLEAVTAALDAPGNEDVAAVTGRVLLAGWYRPLPADAAPEEGLRGHDGSRWGRADERDPGARRLTNSTGNEMTRSGNGRDRDWLAPADQQPAGSQVFGFNGGCVALRRRALDDVGLFDDRLFMYFEDTELSWRLRRAGWRIMHEPGAVTVHQHAASSGTATAFFQVANARNRLVVSLGQAPWAVVLRGLARTGYRLLVGPHRGRTARAVLQALALVPWAVRRRRETDRRARLSRREVAGWLVAD
ncbi:glycosyltransferase family 2 protein [Blastococcus saxobsidens]|uniref:Predicted glycosyltransferase n=1 Tax=Blastococcus saxobsidens (strain DD2) TaxID=1146883 RepID=H6RL17_BLASD|nr:glycosyltransferase family 2 protein [Blastococcus saxobsidens]CCG04984.1 Predicted glycosyltransferase [Blastococcus saxobsidens DD2]